MTSTRMQWHTFKQSHFTKMKKGFFCFDINSYINFPLNLCTTVCGRPFGRKKTQGLFVLAFLFCLWGIVLFLWFFFVVVFYTENVVPFRKQVCEVAVPDRQRGCGGMTLPSEYFLLSALFEVSRNLDVKQKQTNKRNLRTLNAPYLAIQAFEV